MAEYIERERVVDVLVDMETLALYEDAIPAIKNIRRLIDGIPADDVAPVRHGRWIEYPECLRFENAYSDDHIVCSECHKVFSVLDNCTETFNYCPNCGAKMDKENE